MSSLGTFYFRLFVNLFYWTGALDLQSYQVLCEINGKLQQAGNNLDRIAKACNTSMLLGESVATNHQLLESTRQILKENQTLIQTIVAAVINLPAA